MQLKGTAHSEMVGMLGGEEKFVESSDMRKWAGKDREEVVFYLTQAFTKHGLLKLPRC